MVNVLGDHLAQQVPNCSDTLNSGVHSSELEAWRPSSALCPDFHLTPSSHKLRSNSHKGFYGHKV